MSSTPQPGTPAAQCRAFLTRSILPGERVLDVGCGQGELMQVYADAGCEVTGVEIDPQLVAAHRAGGRSVELGTAESLPFADGSFDRVVCSVVLPYTDERRAVAEWARVLRPRGLALATCHGPGYGCYYLLHGDSLKRRIYGGRMLVNTGFYRLTSRRLPGFWGDTLCQGSRQLRRYYRECGMTLETEVVVDRCCGWPRFFGHAVRR
jgi:SAM-dependent methyltransferase